MFGPKYLVLLPFTSDKPLVSEFAQFYMKSKSVSTAMKTTGAMQQHKITQKAKVKNGKREQKPRLSVLKMIAPYQDAR